MDTQANPPSPTTLPLSVERNRAEADTANTIVVDVIHSHEGIHDTSSAAEQTVGSSQLAPDGTTNVPARTFPKFPKLPLELQRKIWDESLTIMPQTINLWWTSQPVTNLSHSCPRNIRSDAVPLLLTTDRIAFEFKIPAMLHVSPETRALALKSYSQPFLNTLGCPLYFLSESDTLYVQNEWASWALISRCLLGPQYPRDLLKIHSMAFNVESSLLITMDELAPIFEFASTKKLYLINECQGPLEAEEDPSNYLCWTDRKEIRETLMDLLYRHGDEFLKSECKWDMPEIFSLTQGEFDRKHIEAPRSLVVRETVDLSFLDS